MATTETLVVEHDSTTLELLLWRRLFRAPPDLVEQTLAINPGLAAAGPILPIGTLVDVEIPSASDRDSVVVVTLWD